MDGPHHYQPAIRHSNFNRRAVGSQRPYTGTLRSTGASLIGRWTQVAPADAQAAQALVRAQLDAFAADDAEQAFAYASPSIRQMFGTPAQFIRMVRSSYPVVYRPTAVVFLKTTTADGALVQPVHITDREGSTWLALYRVQRQDDNTWRIGGCVLMPRAGKTV